MRDFGVNANTDIYYAGRGKYWDDVRLVRRNIYRKISGDPDVAFQEHFAAGRGRTFNKALMLNCGNGWVERELFDIGLFEEVVGVDYGASLLDEARAEAAKKGMPATYYAMDANAAEFPAEGVDLVVNFAAAHHIAYIDRVFRALCALLPEDGWCFSYDYVGPHRNQYRADAWEVAWQLNRSMPAHLRQDLSYPHLPTMLVVDPTEAIHSELVLATFHRYFEVDELVLLGGAIAYPLLTLNEAMFAAPDDEEKLEWIRRISAADEEFLAAHPESSLTAYFTGRPKKHVLADDAALSRWSAEEDERELVARSEGGEYYPRTALQDLTTTSEQRRVEILRLEEELERSRHAAATAAEAAYELAAVRASITYRWAAWVAGTSVARWAKGHRALRRAAGWASRRWLGIPH